MKLHSGNGLDPDQIDARLTAAITRRLIDSGLAQRVRLASLLSTASVPISGEALGRRLGLSRAAIHKHIDQLRSSGFSIESSVGSGYRLAGSPDDLLCAEAVLPFILQSFDSDLPWIAGLPYLFRPTCESTNLLLKGAESLPSGAAAVTDHQTSGRGRMGRTWSDLSGKEIMFSVLLRPALAPAQAHLLSLAAALGVVLTLESRHGLAGRAKVKWPNDVLIDGRKVCGILVEGSMDADRLHWAVAGIGLNANGDSSELQSIIDEQADEGSEKRPQPTSLEECLGEPVARAPLLASLLCNLTSVWRQLESEPAAVASLLRELGRRDALEGSLVEMAGDRRQDAALVGEAAGFGPEGQLLVRTAAGETVAVVAGDVTLRGFLRG